MIVAEPAGTQFIYFNVTRPPFDNKKVRHAIAHAIDKKELIKAAYWGLGETVNNQPFLNRSRLYVPVKDRELDLGKAKQLLAEAGYPNGFKTDALQRSGLTWELTGCEYVIGQLQKIGIIVNMNVIDRAAFVVSMTKGDFNLSITSDSLRLDPDDAFYLYLHSGEIGKNNWSRYQNKEFDALLEKGRTTWKWEERVPIYRKVIEVIQEDLPVLYLAKANNPLFFRDYVKGFDAGASTWFAYYGGGWKKTWLDK